MVPELAATNSLTSPNAVGNNANNAMALPVTPLLEVIMALYWQVPAPQNRCPI
jgi:hypothetical protein